MKVETIHVVIVSLIKLLPLPKEAVEHADAVVWHSLHLLDLLTPAGALIETEHDDSD